MLSSVLQVARELIPTSLKYCELPLEELHHEDSVHEVDWHLEEDQLS